MSTLRPIDAQIMAETLRKADRLMISHYNRLFPNHVS